MRNAAFLIFLVLPLLSGCAGVVNFEKKQPVNATKCDDASQIAMDAMECNNECRYVSPQGWSKCREECLRRMADQRDPCHDSKEDSKERERDDEFLSKVHRQMEAITGSYHPLLGR